MSIIIYYCYQVNIVAHSKDGLDASVYLANNGNTRDVPNLVTLGTSDDDDTLASSDDICSAANEGRRVATHESSKTLTPIIILLQDISEYNLKVDYH